MAEALGGGGSTVQQPAPSAVHGVSAFYAPDPKRASGKLLTSNDLMVMFDVTLMTIYNWRQRKGLPYTKLAGGKKPPVRYDEGLIRHWASIHGVPIKRELQEE